jgi:hypothetical protein
MTGNCVAALAWPQRVMLPRPWNEDQRKEEADYTKRPDFSEGVISSHGLIMWLLMTQSISVYSKSTFTACLISVRLRRLVRCRVFLPDRQIHALCIDPGDSFKRQECDRTQFI